MHGTTHTLSCYGSEPPVSNGVTCRRTAPNFFRPASINRASAKLENRVCALRYVFLLTAAGSFFVFILTCRSIPASCNSSVCAEDVACHIRLPVIRPFRDRPQPPVSRQLRPTPDSGICSFSRFLYPFKWLPVTLFSPQVCVYRPEASPGRTSPLL